VPQQTPEEVTIAITAYLRDLRVQRQISQNYLAQLAGISRTGLSHIESGEVLPSFANVLRISRALGVTVAELLEMVDAN
jgi:transcriptional regulator with XRE-family HTH domain